ncbi:hypothetical protein D9M68_894740 [compost metagenome]
MMQMTFSDAEYTGKPVPMPAIPVWRSTKSTRPADHLADSDPAQHLPEIRQRHVLYRSKRKINKAKAQVLAKVAPRFG